MILLAVLAASAILFVIVALPLVLRTVSGPSAQRAVWCSIAADDFDDVKSVVKSFASLNDLRFMDSSRNVRRSNGLQVPMLNLEVESEGLSILITSFVPVDDPVQERYRVGIAIYCKPPCVEWEARGNGFIDAIVPVTDGTGIVERSVGKTIQ